MERYLVQVVGCQPPWRRFAVEGVPLCDTWTLLSRYSQENRRLTEEMDRAEIIEATQCLLPCSYMEYRVSALLLTGFTSKRMMYKKEHTFINTYYLAVRIHTGVQA